MSGVTYVGGTGQLQLHVGDGQVSSDGAVLLNRSEIAGVGGNFEGNTVPPTQSSGNGL